MPATGYPPPDHILRDLGIRIEVPSATTAAARLPVTPYVTGADGGVRAGVLAVLVDLAGGAAAVRSLYPDWMATADLTVQLAVPAVGPWVEARAAVLRRGRTTLVVEAGIFDVEDRGPHDEAGAGPPGEKKGTQVGVGTLTMAVLPARAGGSELPADPSFPSRSAFGTAGLGRSLADVLGIRVVAPERGRLAMPVVPYVHNSFGAAQGGVMALLGELSGIAAIESARTGTDARASVTDLEVAYLALARIGPVVSEARVLWGGAGDRAGRATVELFDAGGEQRLTTRVQVAVADAAATTHAGAT
ncbi:MAG: PaaI family thioesterase [Acidimicrobiales bacterium]|nr:PaaI family thioesterase [Acidimicrobiales bacterium]